jgi:hypothetical protein
MTTKQEHVLNSIDHQILAILADDPGRSAGEIGYSIWGDHGNPGYVEDAADTKRARKILGYLSDAGYVRSRMFTKRSRQSRNFD